MAGMATNILQSLMENSLKGSALLLGLGLLSLAFLKASAMIRHTLNTLALVGFLALPLLTPIFSNWQLESFLSLPDLSHWFLAEVKSDLPLSLISTMPADLQKVSTSRSFIPELILLLWLVGVGMIAGWFLLMSLRLRRLELSARAIKTRNWLEELAALKKDLGIKRNVTLLKSSEQHSPMTWGMRHPKILLPIGANSWTPEARRIILLHELAHIRRLDWLWQILGLLACTLNWFNPFAWLIFRSMRLEGERAADDLVLLSGTKASSYAAMLLNFSQQKIKVLPSGLTMIKQSHLGSRISSILALHPRNTSPVLITAVVLLALGSLSMLASLNLKGQSLATERLSFHLSWYDPLWGSDLEVYGSGVQFKDDLSGFAKLEPNAFFVLEDKTTQQRYSMQTNQRGRVQESYSIAGKASKADDTWLANLLPAIFKPLTQARYYQQISYASEGNKMLILRAPGLEFQLVKSSPSLLPKTVSRPLSNSPDWFKSWLFNL